MGRHIGMASDPGTKTDIEIIGVVGDTRYQTMKQDPPCQGPISLTCRTSGPPR